MLKKTKRTVIGDHGLKGYMANHGIEQGPDRTESLIPSYRERFVQMFFNPNQPEKDEMARHLVTPDWPFGK